MTMRQRALAPGLPPFPDIDEVAGRYRAFGRAPSGRSARAAAATVREWDDLRRELDTWSRLTRQ